jgi:hypothetical protein
MNRLRQICYIILAVVYLLLGVSAAPVIAAPHSPEIRIGILGNPNHQVIWSDAALERLKAIGFNEVQVNIAWGPRPFGEPLNLVDVVTVPGEKELPGTAAVRAELKRRVALARKHGLRVLFNFGSPRADYDPYTGTDAANGRISGDYRVDDKTTRSWYDVTDPRVRAHELALLAEFRRQFPDISDILVYTYDQHAWQTPEFQRTEHSYGVPLDRRLSPYLKALHKVWTEGRPNASRMWWEPWELSAGQVYAMLPELPHQGFGLIIHSNIAEAQLAQPVDTWVRNTTRLAKDLKLPVVIESFFASATEEIEPLSIPAPRLVDEEYHAFLAVPGVVGIKEYFGINTDINDVDMDVLQARFHGDARSYGALLTAITTRKYGPAAPTAKAYLDLLSDALQTYPWDASWFGREVGKASIDHGWSAATIRGAAWQTPSWQSTRKGRFMKTDDSEPSFWMLEDVQLRCGQTADILDRAKTLYPILSAKLGRASDRAHFAQIAADADRFRRVVRSYEYHLRETNIAAMLRRDLAEQRPLSPDLVNEMAGLLERDAANQDGRGRVVEMVRLFARSPGEFLRRFLQPTTENPSERGDFSLTTR